LRVAAPDGSGPGFSPLNRGRLLSTGARGLEQPRATARLFSGQLVPNGLPASK
jgi:hypothetical protein